MTGGGVRNSFWNQLRADVLGLPLHVPASAEAAFGAAVLAASYGSSLETAVESMVHTREVIQPHADRHSALKVRYLQLIDELRKRGWLPEEVANFAQTRANA
jgi:sugar (pentulose or hexulose) kinase